MGEDLTPIGQAPDVRRGDRGFVRREVVTPQGVYDDQDDPGRLSVWGPAAQTSRCSEKTQGDAKRQGPHGSYV